MKKRKIKRNNENTTDKNNCIESLMRSATCVLQVMVGGHVIRGNPTFFDGEKWVCMDQRFKVETGRCVVLSFGIGNDFSFDDDLDKRFNCKVIPNTHTHVNEELVYKCK